MRRVITTITIILLPALVFAKTGTPLSLQDCIDLALKNQVKMKNALLDQETTLSQNKGILGQALPQVKGTASINYSPLVAAFEVPNFIKYSIGGPNGFVQDAAINHTVFDNPETDNLAFAFQPKWQTTPQLEATQILFDPGITVALQARKKLAELAAKTVSLTREQVIVEVMKSYYSILVAEKKTELLRANISKTDALRNETDATYKAGLAEQIDVDRLTVTLNNLKTEDIKTKQSVALAYMTLKYQVGMPLDEPVSLTDTLSETIVGKDLLNEQFDYNNRKEFQLQQIKLKLESYDVKRYKLSSLPTLNLFGNYGYTLYNSERLFNADESWQRTAMIGIKLAVPIFDGFQRKQKVRQAQITMDKTQNDMDDLKSSLALGKENARINLESNLNSLENEKSNMALAEKVYNTAQIKYKEGVGSSLEVVTAETAYKESQTNYFSALYDAITSGIDLQQALGLIK